MSSINNSTLTNDGGVTNSEQRSLWDEPFVQRCGERHEQHSAVQCNVSAVKWSKDLAARHTHKDVAYKYSYDGLNVY